MDSVFAIFLPAACYPAPLIWAVSCKWSLGGAYPAGVRSSNRKHWPRCCVLRMQRCPLIWISYIGLGWALDGMGNTEIKNAGPVVHHGGSLPSFNSQLLILPEQKLGVVVLTNSSTRPAVDNVATEALILALEAKTGIKQPRRTRPQERSKPLSPEEIRLFTGHYATPIGLVKAYGKSDFLEVEILGNKVSLVPRADGMLAMKYKLFGLIPISLRELDDVGVSRAAAAGHEVLLARSQSP